MELYCTEMYTAWTFVLTSPERRAATTKYRRLLLSEPECNESWTLAYRVTVGKWVWTDPLAFYFRKLGSVDISRRVPAPEC